MLKSILEKLKEDFGYELSNNDYHANVKAMRAWYDGNLTPFHQYKEGGRKQKMSTMGMAKKVGEDYASLIINEKTTVSCDDAEAEKFLIGDKNEQNGGVLNASGFWIESNMLAEKMYGYCGSSAILVSISDPVYREDSKTLTGDKIALRYVTSENIIPLSWRGTTVKEIAVWSSHNYRGDTYIILEIHTVSESISGAIEYKMQTKIYKKSKSTSSLVAADDMLNVLNLVEEVVTEFPLFHVWNTNLVNNKFDNFPLGLSANDNAIPQLEACDLAFNNMKRDIALGAKMIFIQESLIETKLVNGHPVPADPLYNAAPFNVVKDVDMTTQGTQKELIHEHNPSLRSDENIRVIQESLDLLSMKVGFGQNKYNFQQGSPSTAMQVKVSNYDLTYNIAKQQTAAWNMIVSVCKSILALSNKARGTAFDLTKPINVTFDDAALRDINLEKTQDMQLVSQKIMGKAEYREKWFGETEAEAKEAIAEIQSSEPDSMSPGIDDFFGRPPSGANPKPKEDEKQEAA